MAFTDRQLLDSLSRMPFIDTAELAGVLGEAHATVHRALTGLLADGVVGRANHGTAQLPSSQRYHLTAQGIREAAGILGFATPSDFVRAYPVSSEWLTLLVRRIDAVAAVYRLAASLSPGIDGLRSHVEFHRRGRFDATITLHDARSFGVVRQGLALRRRSLYDRLRAIAEYDYTRRPDTVLVLVPSVWEERLTTRFCEDRNIRDCYLAVESRDALESRDLRLWRKFSWGRQLVPHTEGRERPRQPRRRDSYAVAAPSQIGEYFRFYNTQRPHQALEYRTPAEVDTSEREADMVHSQGTLTLTKGVKTAGPDLSFPSFLSN